MKVLILGSSGMLGTAFVKLSKHSKNIDYFFTARTKSKIIKIHNLFNIPSKKIIQLDISKKNLSKKLIYLKKYKFDYIINCIGLIKPYIDEKNSKSINNAININSLFPIQLSSIFNDDKTKIFQIATDCVYNGKKKLYTEKSNHDAEDVYGKTKSLGEVQKYNFFNIRCSIIGEEIDNKLSLIEWFKSQPKNSKLNGFSNHRWNGLTTNAFANLIETIILNHIPIPNNLHLVPKNILSKYDLLLCLKKLYNRDDLNIKRINHLSKIDRTIDTINKKINDKIWKNSLYKKKLTIEKMIELTVI